MRNQVNLLKFMVITTLLFSRAVFAANISVADTSVMEGDAGTTNIFFTITRDDNTNPTNLDFQFGSGTAFPEDWDTSAASGSIAVGAGGPLQFEISVPVFGDNKVELDETITLQIMNSDSGTDTIVDGNAIGTVINDDTAVISVADTGATEGSPVVFSITCDNPVDVLLSFDLVFNGITAVLDGEDATVPEGVASNIAGFDCDSPLPAGSNTVPDNVVELDETFAMTLSNLDSSGRDVIFSDGSVEVATGTIENDDSATLSYQDASGLEGTNIEVGLVISNPVDVSLNFDIASADGTATTADSDYTAFNGQSTIGANQSGTIVGIIALTTTDNTVELDETYTFTASNLDASGRDVSFADDTAEVTIENDDSAVINVAGFNVLEGTNPSPGNVALGVTLSNPVDTPVTFDFMTVDGTAVAPDDYSAVNGSILWTANDNSARQIIVPVMRDAVVESDESLDIQVSNLQAGGRDVLLDGNSTLGLLNDDVTTISINDVTGLEGSACCGETTPFVFTVSSSLETDISIDFGAATAPGTADSPQDFQGFGLTPFTIAAGTTSVDIPVQVNPDFELEMEETFFVNLTLPVVSYVTAGDVQGLGTILDDDSYPVPTLSQWSVLLMSLLLFALGAVAMRRRAVY